MAYCSRFEAAKLLPFYCFLAKEVLLVITTNFWAGQMGVLIVTS